MVKRPNDITTYFFTDLKIDNTQPEQKRAEGKHIVGYNKAWETEFPWLMPIAYQGDSVRYAMFCVQAA